MFETIFACTSISPELVRILISLNPWQNNVLEAFQSNIYLFDFKTFEEKHIICNKFVTLQMVDVLYVRVRTFIKHHFTTRYYGTSS